MLEPTTTLRLGFVIKQLRIIYYTPVLHFSVVGKTPSLTKFSPKIFLDWFWNFEC